MKGLSRQRKRVKVILGALLALVLTAFTIAKGDLFEIGKNIEIFSALYKQVNLHYVEKVDADILMKKGIDAMLEELDPYTEFIPESALEDFRLKYVNTQYGGLGAEVWATKAGQVIVAEIFEGYAAHRFGLHVGDEILAVDGIPVYGKEPEDISHLLKGSEGSIVRLKIRDSKSATIKELAITRDRIVQPNVSYSSLLAGNIGYIKLDKFLSGAAEEMHEAIIDLHRQSRLNGLILDLRDNGGGILQESVKIVNLFVNQGEKVVTQKGKDPDNIFTYITSTQALVPHLPLVVLINENSASASEIVAGALQDMDRAVIIGERSFGKGLVQQTYRLPFNNMVKVTVAKYYTPSGRCIQALDYAHKDKKGQAIKVEDSLAAEFTTKMGRKVYDGNGIYPDIEISKDRSAAIVRTLNKQLLIPTYATNYYNRHIHIEDAANFRLTDNEYQDFLNFLSTQDVAYSSRSARVFSHLKKIIEAEELSDDVVSELEAVKLKILAQEQRALLLYKDEIKAALETEIVSRYYYQKGKYAYTLKRDDGIVKAQEVLQPKSKLVYQQILSGKGQYGIIGKPGIHLAAVAK